MLMSLSRNSRDYAEFVIWLRLEHVDSSLDSADAVRQMQAIGLVIDLYHDNGAVFTFTVESFSRALIEGRHGSPDNS